MARLMYARSLEPSDASMSLRISSSDNAIASTSASLRWAYSVTSAMATLHHIPTRRWVMRRVRKPGGLNAGGETGLRKSHAKTHSVPSPRRRLHRRRLNVSITTRGRIIEALWHPKLIAASGRFGIQTDIHIQTPGALIAPTVKPADGNNRAASPRSSPRRSARTSPSCASRSMARRAQAMR